MTSLKGKARVLNAFTYKQFQREADRPIDWIVENLIADEGSTLLVGHPKSNKTRFINAVIAARSSGCDLAGLKVKPGHTILCSLEHGRSLVLSGLKAAAKGQGIKSLRVTVVRPPLGIDAPEQVQALGELVESKGADLLVVDCTRRLGAHNEDSSAEVNRILQALGAITERCALVLIHHLGKNNTVRGSTDWVAGTDSKLLLKKTTKGVSVHAEHHHIGDHDYEFAIDGEEDDALIFKKASEADPTSDEIRDAVLRACKEKPLGVRALRDRARALGVRGSQTKFTIATSQLEAKGLIHKNAKGKWTASEGDE